VIDLLEFAVIAPVVAGVTADPGWMSAFARHVESCGFESIVAVEHDADGVELSLGHLVSKVDADRAGRLAELGADLVVLAMPPASDLGEAKDVLSACAQRLTLDA
jgi:hypothetical protein